MNHSRDGSIIAEPESRLVTLSQLRSARPDVVEDQHGLVVELDRASLDLRLPANALKLQDDRLAVLGDLGNSARRLRTASAGFRTEEEHMRGCVLRSVFQSNLRGVTFGRLRTVYADAVVSDRGLLADLDNRFRGFLTAHCGRHF